MGARDGDGMKRIFFLFGAGYSAKAFARLAIADGHRVFGTTRSAEKTEGLRALGVEPFLFDGVSIDAAVKDALQQSTHVIISAAPGDEGDPVLDAAGATIRQDMPDLRWIAYLSTVGVYGDHEGDWVDEETPCRPVSTRSIQRLAAERAWTDFAGHRNVPLAILRLSGIYGPGRNAFVNLERGTAKRIVKPGQVFNRIHVADIAGALAHLAHRETGGVFNVTDDEPAPPQDVVAYAASLMNVAPPPETPFAQAQMTPMARSFYGENKRVSNAKLKAGGYVFRHPTYAHAFDAMWRDHDWRGEASD
jgi:nucleoside-diphosphate-sugar epimerase